MTWEPVDRCQCGGWVYYGNKCSVCFAQASQAERQEIAMKRMIAAILREKNSVGVPIRDVWADDQF